MLDVEHLDFSYGSVAVLEDIVFSLSAGEVLALLGPNGAGKSTLVSLLIGLRKPSAGSILLNGYNPATRSSARHRIGWVPQSITLFQQLTVLENLRALGRIMGCKGAELQVGIEQALELTGLETKREMRAAALSGGQQRLLNVGMALVHRPDLLILDEPTAGVDRNAKRQLKRMIRELRKRGVAILLTTHELEDANELADRLLILVDGTIRASGDTAGVIQAAFSQNREVSVWLARGGSQAEGLRICREQLSQAGLQAGDNPEQWLGLMDNSRGQVDQLLHELLGQGEHIREVRVRSPSLELLIGKLSKVEVTS